MEWPEKMVLRVGNVSHIVRASQPGLARLDAFKKRARRKKKPVKVPGNAARRGRSPQPPRAVEHYFALVLKRATKAFSEAVKRVVLPKVGDFAREETERADAEGDEKASRGRASAVAKQMKSAARKAFNISAFERDSDTASKRTTRHSENEFRRLGIDVVKEPPMKWLVDGWRKDNVSRITKMHDDEIDKVEKILAEGFGRSRESISKDIVRQFDDVSQSRAELIARDQILTLNAQITRYRQGAAGITSYVWTTSGDERVRPEHEELDGEEFDWDSGGDPEEGHPGEPINCRCTAFPILPELEDDEEDEPKDEPEPEAEEDEPESEELEDED